jgi:hypothetical protein
MNNEDIIRIAKDGGISLENAIYRDVVLAVAAIVAAQEREACAKVCDGWSKRDDDVGGFIGRAIRARGET